MATTRYWFSHPNAYAWWGIQNLLMFAPIFSLGCCSWCAREHTTNISSDSSAVACFVDLQKSKIRMKLYALALFLSAAYAQTDEEKAAVINLFGTDKPTQFVPPDYEVVTPKGLGGPLIALERCGEGADANKKVCVSYHRCDPGTNTVTEEEVVNTDGAGLIDIRAGEGLCESYLDVCCKLPEGVITTKKPPVVIPDTIPEPKLYYCGIRNAGGIDFKITGNTNNEAEYGEFPWMVAILKTNPTPKEEASTCGGALITPEVVLTGAHCVYNQKASNLKIRAGEWDTQTTKERLPYQERGIKQVILHENFNSNNLFNDVALLILDTLLDPADNVGTICLPPQSQKFTANNCFASGWGKTAFAEKKYSAILKKIELPIVDNNRCQTALRTTRLGPNFKLDKSFTCAGGDAGKDTCTGDGGSPLVCPDPLNPNRYQVAGLVAWGIGCGEKKIPGVYVDVAQFRSWIDGHLQRLNIDTNPYNF